MRVDVQIKLYYLHPPLAMSLNVIRERTYPGSNVGIHITVLSPMHVAVGTLFEWDNVPNQRGLRTSIGSSYAASIEHGHTSMHIRTSNSYS